MMWVEGLAYTCDLIQPTHVQYIPIVSLWAIPGCFFWWHSVRASEACSCWVWMFNRYWARCRNQPSMEYFTGSVTTINHYNIWRFVATCSSVCHGTSVETIWLRETICCISGHWATEPRTGQSLSTSHGTTVATEMDTSFLDGLYKTREHYEQLPSVAWAVRAK